MKKKRTTEDEPGQLDLFDVEIEQKYLHKTGEKAVSVYPSMLAALTARFAGRASVVDFRGTDHNFNVRKNGELTLLRFRTDGLAQSRGKLCVKTKTEAAGSCVRNEHEIELDPEGSQEKVLGFLGCIAQSLGDSYERVTYETEGRIWMFPVSGRPELQVEVVVYLYRNRTNGKNILVTEIEAHGYRNETDALIAIQRYEEELGWFDFREARGCSELLA